MCVMVTDGERSGTVAAFSLDGAANAGRVLHRLGADLDMC